MRRRFRRDDEYRTDDVSGPVMVAPADESSDHEISPKTLN
jgi:hypothetical protein